MIQSLGKTSRREKVLVGVTVLAIAFSYHKFWYSKRKQEGVRISERIVQLQTDIKKNEDLHRKLTDVSRSPSSPNVGNFGGEEKLKEYLDRNRKFANIIDQFSLESEDFPFRVTRMSVDKEEKFNEFSKTLFSLDVEASFLSIGKFLERIENSSLLTEVQSVEISRIGNELKRCTAKIKLYGYVSRS